MMYNNIIAEFMGTPQDLGRRSYCPPVALAKEGLVQNSPKGRGFVNNPG